MAACRGRRAGRGRRRRSTPSLAASCASATRWRSLAWTPPGPISADRRGGAPCAPRARLQAVRSAGRAKNVPSSIAASMRGRSWRTGRPAPRLRCPTSELPIWPGGRPTASSDASSRACGQRSSSARQTRHRRGGDRVAAPDRAPIPNPSRTTRTIGRGRARRPVVGSGTLAVRRRARPRARAVMPARATIPAISSGLSEAPPTSAPSIDGSARNSSMFAARHAAAVEHRDVGGDRAPARSTARRVADRIGHRRRVRAARVAARADRPDRLVGDDEPAVARPTPARRPASAAARAGRRRRRSLARASRSASCSPTHRIGRRPASTRPGELAADQLVGLAGVPPPLGVADDHPASRGRRASAPRPRRCRRRPARDGRSGRRPRRPDRRLPARRARPRGRRTAGR